MLEHTFVRPSVIARLRRGPMGPYLDNLAASLRQDGYASSTTQRYLCAAEKFAHWLQKQGYAACEMDEDLLQRYLAGLPRYGSGKRTKAAQGLRTLLRLLHQQDVTRPRQAGLPTPPIDQWLSDYDAHLDQVSGLTLGTRHLYRPLVRRFITHCFGTAPPDWRSLTAARITTFVSQEAARRRGTGCQLPAVAVRSFLKFLVFRGEIRPGLEAVAPLPPRWKNAPLLLRLTSEEVERVLAVYPDETAISRRNRAILLLLARLGLRPQDVVSLGLDDIDWANGRLDLRPGKSRRARSLPLPDEVGQAIVTYLQGGRPQSPSRQVFLRSRPPFRALQSGSLRGLVRHAFEHAGLVVPPGVASRIFRHTVASMMVNRGASFKDVADVLGHQSIETTEIYAKLDLDTLAAVALPWGGDAP